MLTRRHFLKMIGIGVITGAVASTMPDDSLFAMPTHEQMSEVLRVALLADSHLPNANPENDAAMNLITAVSEINALNPPVDLVLMAGDLTDNGNIETLLLGKEILSHLRAPYWLVPGERDNLAALGSPWNTIFGSSTFFFTYQGVHFCGLDTSVFDPVTGRKFFQFSRQQYRWLARELSYCSPTTPFVVFSHAPLYRLFQPWQWWTEQAEALHDLLLTQKTVYLLHGHVHQNIALRHRNLFFQGLRSTAWPHPDVRIGCQSPKLATVGAKSRMGCGWMLLTIHGNGGAIIQDQVWEV